MTSELIKELREWSIASEHNGFVHISKIEEILSRHEANKSKTAADMAMPIAVVTDNNACHKTSEWENLVKTDPHVTLEVGTKLYLHPEGNETPCDMCEVLAKFTVDKAVEPSKHYKCPVCHTRFTREYPFKPSDTKEVKAVDTGEIK